MKKSVLNISAVRKHIKGGLKRMVDAVMAVSKKINLDDAERTWLLSDSSPVADQIGVRFNEGKALKITIFTVQGKELRPRTELHQIEIAEKKFDSFRHACWRFINYLFSVPPVATPVCLPALGECGDGVSSYLIDCTRDLTWFVIRSCTNVRKIPGGGPGPRNAVEQEIFFRLKLALKMGDMSVFQEVLAHIESVLYRWREERRQRLMQAL